jgi:hypothetical protein
MQYSRKRSIYQLIFLSIPLSFQYGRTYFNDNCFSKSKFDYTMSTFSVVGSFISLWKHAFGDIIETILLTK